MICQRMMVGGSKQSDAWQFTINTEATSQGERKTGIPFSLYNQDNVALTVDWGDETTSILTSANYTINDSTASVHEYAIPGIYTVTIRSSDWARTRLLFVYPENLNYNVSLTDATAPVYYMQRTIISLDSQIPRTLGMNQVYGRAGTSITQEVFDDSLRFLFFRCSKLTTVVQGFLDKATSITDLYCMFCRCTGLTTIPDGFLSNYESLTTTHYLWYGCTSMNSIPANLFNNSPNIRNMYGTFSGCSGLGDFDITISATGVLDVTDFVPFKSGASRIVRVPSGSTTETTFNAVASSLGLTIIGE